VCKCYIVQFKDSFYGKEINPVVLIRCHRFTIWMECIIEQINQVLKVLLQYMRFVNNVLHFIWY
jgi:hypothetical protein